MPASPIASNEQWSATVELINRLTHGLTRGLMDRFYADNIAKSMAL